MNNMDTMNFICKEYEKKLQEIMTPKEFMNYMNYVVKKLINFETEKHPDPEFSKFLQDLNKKKGKK